MFQNMLSWVSVEIWRPAQILDNRLSWHLKFSSYFIANSAWPIKNNMELYSCFPFLLLSLSLLSPLLLFPIPFVSVLWSFLTPFRPLSPSHYNFPHHQWFIPLLLSRFISPFLHVTIVSSSLSFIPLFLSYVCFLAPQAWLQLAIICIQMFQLSVY